LWEDLMTRFPKIDAAYFHNDDMALAAYKVMVSRHRTSIKIGGCDAMPPALESILAGKMTATVRNPSCRTHGYSLIAGLAAVVSGEKTGSGIPKNIVVDGPVVTDANAPGMLWMERHFLI
ncbi:MAG: hypothetical protein ACREE3_16480, partial [Stellaceae bacterium]